jgi:hypothetical protein
LTTVVARQCGFAIILPGPRLYYCESLASHASGRQQ